MAEIIKSPLDKKAIFINKKTNKIEFRDTRYYECVEKEYKGQFVPSSTTVLNNYPKPAAFYDWLKRLGSDADAVSADAMEKGSNIHALTEVFDLNGSVNFKSNDNQDIRKFYKENEIEQFHRYFNFSERYKPTIIANEWSVGSGKLGYGGTLDRVIELKGETWLIDIKTGNEYEYYWCQLASYKQLWENFNPHIPIKKVGILYLNTSHRTEKDLQGIGWQLKEMPAALTDRYKTFEPYKYWLWRFGKYLSEFQEIHPNAGPKSKVFQLEYTKNW
jgi:hypothetical protein